MSGSLTIKFDTISQERRDIYAAAMLGILETIMKGADEVNITYTSETPCMRGKHKTTKTTKWEVGQDAPTFEELGIYNTQHDMFETVRGDYRTFTAPIGSGQDGTGTAVAEAEEDQPLAEADADQPVGLIPTDPEVEPLPLDDQAQPPTVEDTAEALGPWAYLLEQPTDQDEDDTSYKADPGFAEAEAKAEEGPAARDLEGDEQLDTDQQDEDQDDAASS